MNSINKIFLTLTVSFLLIMKVNAQTYQINGQLEGLSNTSVTINFTIADKKTDTVIKAIGGKFTFKGTVNSATIHYLNFGENRYFNLVISPGETVHLTGSINDLAKVKVVGAVEDRPWRAWIKTWDKMHNDAGILYKRLDSLTKAKADTKQISDELTKGFDLKMIDSVGRFVKKYPASAVSPWVIYNRFVDYPNPEKAAFFYTMLKGQSKKSAYGIKLNEAITQSSKIALGKSPDFKMANNKGGDFKLSSLKGKVVLVDFWASWCAPCRKENPNLVKAYANYKDRGFEIVGVSLDEKREAWLGAIQTDGLTWIHVSELKGWKSELAFSYGIKAIPVNFLMDANGIIIAKDLRGDELENKLKGLFAGKETEKAANVYSSAAPIGLLEKDLVDAYDRYDATGNTTAADSVFQVAKTQFPEGKLMRDYLMSTALLKHKDNLTLMDDIFAKCLAAYPRAKYPGTYVVYDYNRAGLGVRHANIGNTRQALAYASHFDNQFWSGEGLTVIANALLKRGDTVNAMPLVKRAVDAVQPFLNAKPVDNQAGFALAGYPASLKQYAFLLFRQGNTKEALQYIQESEKYSRIKDEDFYMVYAMILNKLEMYSESLNQLEASYIAGNSSQFALSQLAKAYQHKNGNMNGYEPYLADLKTTFFSKVKEKITKETINEPAVPFGLKDLDGKLVKLSDLKGKVVVLDFWATWCGPCIRSFPAMSKAVAKFKNDPDVAFLFIDTFERAANSEELARSFLTKNSYSFNVLFDPVVKEGKSVAQNYGIDAIPVKIVIDGNGRVRFRLAGFSGSDEAAVEELSAMIAFAKKGV